MSVNMQVIRVKDASAECLAGVQVSVGGAMQSKGRQALRVNQFQYLPEVIMRDAFDSFAAVVAGHDFAAQQETSGGRHNGVLALFGSDDGLSRKLSLGLSEFPFRQAVGGKPSERAPHHV